MIFSLRKFQVVFLILGALSTPSFAEEKSGGGGDKQAIKTAHRWSLSDWLETKDKMRIMDLWLAMHTPSPYEFYVAGAYKSGSISATGANYQGWDFTAAAYAYIFGVELQYQTSSLTDRWLGLANVRVFGYYNQGTNLTLQIGVKNEERMGLSLWNPAAGLHMTLYFAKPAGISMLYRHYFPRASGVATSGDRFEIGAFIDFKFVRVFGDYIVESEVSDPFRSYSGFQLGTRVYF